MLTLEPGYRKRKTVFEVHEKRRKATEERNKTRVFLGTDGFARWRDLKTRAGLRTDAEVATLLLNCYQKQPQTASSASTASEPDNVENQSEKSSGPKPTQTTSTTSTASQTDDLETPQIKPEPQINSPGPGLNLETPQIKSEPQIYSPGPGPGPGLNLEKLQIKPEPHINSPGLGPGPGPESGLKCPSCGFVLSQWLLQNRNILDEAYQPQSIEVTVELEESEESEETEKSEESESEAEGADQSEDSSEESEGSGVELSNGENWPPKHQSKSKQKDRAEESDPKLKEQLCTECGEFYTKKHQCDHKTKPFVCNACGRRFISEPALKIHSNIHSETHEFHCKYCYVSFKTKVKKLTHELIHLKQNDPFKCPLCPLTFRTFKERATHKKQHSNQYTCKVCGTEFDTEQHFMRHVAVHTGERAFRCSVCDMSFKQESHLKSHMRLHTGERPYECKYCPKAFNHNVSLKSHVQRYHPEEEEKEREERSEPPEKRRKKKRTTPPTGRPVGRPKRSPADIRKFSSRKRFKPLDSDEGEREESFISFDLL